MYDDILLDIHKPAQYIGREVNSVKKDFQPCKIKFVISFPDLYEVGMSNLGLYIIYGILNNINDIVCERVFSPQKDLEELLRTQNREILSLESQKRLREFDFIGFSLGSELCYTNVLNILDLGRIPFKSESRDHTYPLVIGGGPSTINPEPMHEFFDIFCLGEAEDLIIEVMDLYRRYKDAYKQGSLSKQELLNKFSQLEGVYVPSFYEAFHDEEGRVVEFRAKEAGTRLKIKKRIVGDLNSSYYPFPWMVPYIQIIHDRLNLEVMRGCPNQCRFCQARSQYFPFRQRNKDNVLSLADKLYKCSGYEEVALTGLSVSDHPQLGQMLKELIELFETKSVSLSLPSIKAKALIGEISAVIASVKKTGLTFAPEAGSERLRNILRKDFNTEEFFAALAQAYASGYQHVKLYFMIGLPYEQQEDLDAIVDFSLAVSELKRKSGSSAAGVNISINTLIPKPHTSFQWFGVEDLESIKSKQEYLREKTKKLRKLNLTFHNRYMSLLEGILSRGDRRLSRVIFNAFKRGAKFDAWGEHFNFDIWLTAFKDAGVDPGSYLKARGINEILPWDFVEIGVDKELLASDFSNLIKA